MAAQMSMATSKMVVLYAAFKINPCNSFLYCMWAVIPVQTYPIANVTLVPT